MLSGNFGFWTRQPRADKLSLVGARHGFTFIMKTLHWGQIQFVFYYISATTLTRIVGIHAEVIDKECQTFSSMELRFWLCKIHPIGLVNKADKGTVAYTGTYVLRIRVRVKSGNVTQSLSVWITSVIFGYALLLWLLHNLTTSPINALWLVQFQTPL